jgi:hypothetical protein
MVKSQESLFSVQFSSLAIKLVYALVLALILVAVIHPDVRSQVRDLVNHRFRTVLSTAVGDLRGDGAPIKVVKVKTQDTIYLEFYTADEKGSDKLLQRVDVGDKRDAYFNYRGEATNLVLADIDNDAHHEILVPSIDQEMRAHLNIFRFDPLSGQFARVFSARPSGADSLLK